MDRRPLLILVALASVTSAPAQDGPCAIRWPGRSFPLGASCLDLAFEDFDQDGRRDIVGLTQDDGDLVWLAGEEFGFGPPVVTLLAAAAPGRMASGDLNGDGTVDLVISRAQVSSLICVPGNGTGGFLPPVFSSGLATHRRPVLADLDLDGDLDPILRSFQTGAVEILTNDGEGSFVTSVLLAVGAPGSAPITADIDADGAPDVTVPVQSAQHAMLYLGDGTGTYGTPLTLEMPPYVGDLEATDLADDGLPDLLAVGGFAGLALMRNRGGLDFDPPVFVPSVDFPFMIEMDDVDGDGDLDVLVPSGLTSGVAVHLRGFDGFSPAEVIGTYAGSATRLAAADVMGGPAPDVLLFKSGEFQVQFFEGDESGGAWFDQGEVKLTKFDEVFAITAADMNDDGLFDLVGCSFGSVGVALSAGGAEFSTSSIHAVELSFAVGVEAADLDGDGVTDVIVMADYPSGQLLRGVGDGSLKAPSPMPWVSSPQAFELADIDVDGDLDVVIGAYTGVTLVRGDGAGGFATPTQIPGTSFVRSVAVADLDVGGVPDVAFTRFSPTGIGVLFDPGTSTSPDCVHVPWPGLLDCVQTADVNLDGLPDLIAASMKVEHLVLLPGSGAGAFGAPSTVDTGSSSLVYSLDAHDVNGDGSSDLVVGHGAQGLALLESDGIGGLREPVSTATIGAWLTALGDFDGDGRIDVATGGHDHRVTVLRGRPVAWWSVEGGGCPGEGGFVPALTIPSCYDPTVQLGVRLEGAPGGADALVLIGAAAPPEPIGWSGCFLRVAPLVAVPVPLGGSGPGNGSAALVFGVPPGAIGLTFSMQAAVRDAAAVAGFTVTNALDFELP